MNQEIKRQWVEALRSGRFNQFQNSNGAMRRDDRGKGKHVYTALGVLFEITYGIEDPYEAVLPPSESPYEYFELAPTQVRQILSLNERFDFNFIASFIEREFE